MRLGQAIEGEEEGEGERGGGERMGEGEGREWERGS